MPRDPTRTEHFSIAALVRRGWTRPMVAALLGDPDMPADMGRSSLQEAPSAMVGARCNIVARARPTIAEAKTLTA
jgi:hypothetical protein